MRLLQRIHRNIKCHIISPEKEEVIKIEEVEDLFYSKEEAIELYLGGEKIRDISRNLKISESTFIRRLKEMGIYKRKNNVPFTESEKKKIIDMRRDGYGKAYIAETLDLPVKRVEKYIDSLGIRYRKRTPSRNNNSLYSVDKEYFNIIDTQEKAYWLGFILADGSISKYRLTIKLSSVDHNHIQSFKEEIGFTGSIATIEGDNDFKTGYEASLIEINNRDIVDGLNKFMPVGKKSDSIRLPNVREDLIKHVVRGYFDGDGYIVKTRKHMGFCGNEDFLRDLSELFLKKGLRKDNEGYISNRNGRYGELNYSKRATKEILEWMYDGANIYLERKYDNYYN